MSDSDTANEGIYAAAVWWRLLGKVMDQWPRRALKKGLLRPGSIQSGISDDKWEVMDE